jgi:hypothetical protein
MKRLARSPLVATSSMDRIAGPQCRNKFIDVHGAGSNTSGIAATPTPKTVPAAANGDAARLTVQLSVSLAYWELAKKCCRK